MGKLDDEIEILKQYLGKHCKDEIAEQIDDIRDAFEYALAHKDEEIKELQGRVAELEPLEIFQRWGPLKNVIYDLALDRLFGILDQIPLGELEYLMDKYDPFTRKKWEDENMQL